MTKEDPGRVIRVSGIRLQGSLGGSGKFKEDIEDLGGVVSLTKASTAMKTWRLNYFPDIDGIAIIRTSKLTSNKPIMEEERRYSDTRVMI